MRYKTAVVTLFSVFLFIGIVSGLYLSQVYQMVGNDFKASLPVEGKQVKEASTNPVVIRAMLKGSIYESGEQVTVYGACFDGFGYLLPSSNATFSSWYPNGTQEYNESTMTSVDSSGRFYIIMNMSDTQGTYLTQVTCWYAGDYAIAFGEWQNPNWVKRIKDTQTSVDLLTNISAEQYTNISNMIESFSNETQINFSQVLSAISGINVSGGVVGLDTQLKEVYNQVHALDTSFWAIDVKAPWYSFGSNVFNFRAVDMLSLSDIYAVSDDGYAVYWDGETWQIRANYSDIKWYGVSVLPASIPYAWFVGQNASLNTSVYSINGGAPATITGSAGTKYLDIKLFPSPNSPSAYFYTYILEDDGNLWLSVNNGVNFSSVAVMNSSCSPDKARLSQIIYNTDLGVASGYRLAGVMCNEFIYYNGSGYNLFTESNQQFADVEIVYNDLAYAVSKDQVTDELKIWKFNGTGLELVYKANDTTIDPRGIAAAATNDVWVVTNNPSVYYHYDGFKWEYANYPYSGAIGIGILFTNGTIPGLYDIAMFNSKNAYAVGTDGLIMKFYSVFNKDFDKIINDISNLSNTLNLSMLNNIYNMTANLTNIVVGMNQSLMNQLTIIDNRVIDMNATMNVRFDQVVNNISYMQLYLNSTIYPLLNDILVRLGVIETNVNATLLIVNETQVTVNQMNSTLNNLMNQTSRIKAWVTQ